MTIESVQALSTLGGWGACLIDIVPVTKKKVHSSSGIVLFLSTPFLFPIMLTVNISGFQLLTS